MRNKEKKVLVLKKVLHTDIITEDTVWEKPYNIIEDSSIQVLIFGAGYMPNQQEESVLGDVAAYPTTTLKVLKGGNGGHMAKLLISPKELSTYTNITIANTIDKGPSSFGEHISANSATRDTGGALGGAAFARNPYIQWHSSSKEFNGENADRIVYQSNLGTAGYGGGGGGCGARKESKNLGKITTKNRPSGTMTHEQSLELFINNLMELNKQDLLLQDSDSNLLQDGGNGGTYGGGGGGGSGALIPFAAVRTGYDSDPQIIPMLLLGGKGGSGFNGILGDKGKGGNGNVTCAYLAQERKQGASNTTCYATLRDFQPPFNRDPVEDSKNTLPFFYQDKEELFGQNGEAIDHINIDSLLTELQGKNLNLITFNNLSFEGTTGSDLIESDCILPGRLVKSEPEAIKFSKLTKDDLKKFFDDEYLNKDWQSNSSARTSTYSRWLNIMTILASLGIGGSGGGGYGGNGGKGSIGCGGGGGGYYADGGNAAGLISYYIEDNTYLTESYEAEYFAASAGGGGGGYGGKGANGSVGHADAAWRAYGGGGGGYGDVIRNQNWAYAAGGYFEVNGQNITEHPAGPGICIIQYYTLEWREANSEQEETIE